MVADAINDLFQKHGKPRIAGGLPGYSKQPSHERLLAHRNHRFKTNLWMPPWAAPKNRAEARRRRKVVAKPEPAKYVAADATTGVRRSPEERAARLLVVWPVPKDVAPKRVSAATAVTIAVAEAGVIPAPHDEADFTRARKRIEAVYRRWYDTCFLPCPDGAMEALKTWFIAALRTRQDARP